MKAFYRVPEASEILNFRRTKTYQMIREGKIPSAVIDGNIRIPVKDLHDWIDAQIARGKRHPSNGQVQPPRPEPNK